MPVALFGFGLAFSLFQVFGTSDGIKHAFSESGVYDTAAANLLASDTSKASGANKQDGEAVPLDNPEVRKAIEKAFPGSSLQPQVEKALDSTYSWIHGESKQLNISFNLSQNKDMLLTNLMQEIKQRTATLPTCPAGTPIPAEFDAFNATCRPAQLSADQAAAMAEEKLRGNDFFKESSLDAGNIKDEKGQTLEKRLSNVPGIYDRVVKGIAAAGLLAVVFTLAIIFLTRPWRDGIRRVAKISLTIGITTIVLACLSVFLSGKAADMVAKSAGNTTSFQASVVDIIHILASDIRAWWLGYGILLVVLSVGAFLGLRILREKSTIDRNNATPPENRPHVVVN